MTLEQIDQRLSLFPLYLIDRLMDMSSRELIDIYNEHGFLFLSYPLYISFDHWLSVHGYNDLTDWGKFIVPEGFRIAVKNGAKPIKYFNLLQ